MTRNRTPHLSALYLHRVVRGSGLCVWITIHERRREHLHQADRLRQSSGLILSRHWWLTALDLALAEKYFA